VNEVCLIDCLGIQTRQLSLVDNWERVNSSSFLTCMSLIIHGHEYVTDSYAL
jgi:hypothetical protein